MTGRMIGVAVLVAAFMALLALGGLRAWGGSDGQPEKEGDVEFQRVRLDGRMFRLEIADTPEKRFKGLSHRTEIPENGGMLFIFPREHVRVQQFVMRDCSVDIDIIYLDPSGRIVAMHEMKVEPPRGPDEGKPGEINEKYERRLKAYSSRYPAQFVIEIKGGTLPKMQLKEGDKVDLPLAALKARAR